MRFVKHYSGSSGNLYEVVADNGNRLLIECGVSWSKIEKALDYDLHGIIGCLLTHEHNDHSFAVVDVLKAGIPVYSAWKTLKKLNIATSHKARFGAEFSMLKEFGFTVRGFTAHHDAVDPAIFFIQCDDQNLLFATDTSHIAQTFDLPLDIICIECGYDREILDRRRTAGDIDKTLARRLLTSHMEKNTTIRYLDKFCNRSRCTEIHLLHLSRDTINGPEAVKEIEDKFMIKVCC